MASHLWKMWMSEICGRTRTSEACNLLYYMPKILFTTWLMWMSANFCPIFLIPGLGCLYNSIIFSLHLLLYKVSLYCLWLVSWCFSGLILMLRFPLQSGLSVLSIELPLGVRAAGPRRFCGRGRGLCLDKALSPTGGQSDVCNSDHEYRHTTGHWEDCILLPNFCSKQA